MSQRAIPAVIVAGGRGVRMGAATAERPKPMIPVAGKPMLEHQLLWLKSWGIEQVWLCLGYKPDPILRYFEDGRRWGMCLSYAVEGDPRGTAGAVKDIFPKLGAEALVVYGDLFVEMDLGRFLKFHAEDPEAAGTLCVSETDHPLDSDLVALEGERVTRLYRARPEQPYGSTALSAIWAVREPLMALVPQDRPSDFGRETFPQALAAGLRLRAYRTQEPILDLGTPERLAAFERGGRA